MSVIIPIGYSFFLREKANDPKLQKLLTFKRKTILYAKQSWKIYEQNFEKTWGVIFLMMKESQVIQLHLDHNKCETMLKLIQEPDFTRLKHLNLQSNNISNMEKLHLVKMPEVEVVSLSNNRIHTIRSFRKNGFKKLVYLNLTDNPILDLQSLCEFGNKNLSKIALQWQDSQVTGESIVWTLKLAFPVFKYLRIQSSKRIGQREVIEMLSNKYEKVQVWSKNSKQQK